MVVPSRLLTVLAGASMLAVAAASAAAAPKGKARTASSAHGCGVAPTAKQDRACRAVVPKALRRSRVRGIGTFTSVAGSDGRVAFASPNIAVAGPAQAPEAVPPAALLAAGRRARVRPVFECVYRDPTGQPVAVFGYDNPTNEAVAIPVGRRNWIRPRPGFRGQPVTFAAGRAVGVFRVPMGSSPALTWRLDRARAEARIDSGRACEDPNAIRDDVAVVTLDDTAGGPEYWSLRAVGVPAVLATSVGDAVRSRVVLLAGTLSAGVVSPSDRALLEAHVARGGVVIAEAVTDPALYDLFGIDSVTESRTRTAINWRADDATTRDLNRPEERAVSLTSNVPGDGIGTVGYQLAFGTDALASYDDQATAVARRRNPGGGAAYVVGARLLDLVTRHHQQARLAPRELYENVFDTSADGWMLWLRGVYRTHVGGGVTLSTVPEGKQSAVIPTLSLNFSDGVGAVEGYVADARRMNASPTVFVWTHYVTDWLDSDFFAGPRFEGLLRTLRAQGAEIASHSVSHSPRFNRADLVPRGTGTEAYETYRPNVISRDVTRGASVLGDLRVSRQLLQAVQPEVRSYRQGYLLTRPDLAQSEEAAGYVHDSSTTQGLAGGAFPFMLPRLDSRGFSQVVTYPIVLEDERGTAFDQRLAQGRDLIAANAENGAPSVILVHPNPSSAKRAAWSSLLQGLPATAWRGTLDSFGTFWAQRLQAHVTSAPSQVCPGGRHIEVRSGNADWPLERQALDVADPALAELRTASGARIPVSGGKLALPPIAGGTTLVGELCPGSPSGL